jgi:hypothetical protein
VTRALISLGALAAIAVAVTLAARLQPPPRRPSPAAATARPAPSPPTSPPAPRVDRAALDRQDHSPVDQRRRETAAFDDRPLLAQLPLELAGVTIDIAGLAADTTATILRIDPGTRSRAYALGIYRQALAAYGDRGRGYRLEWAS